MCLAFAHLFAPLILVTLVSYPFDGIAIPLLPGLGLVLFAWASGWLLLLRSPQAAQAARTAAIGSLLANVGLVALTATHLWVVEAQGRDGIAHACSSSVTFVVLVFAVVSIVQALVTVTALRIHSFAIGWRS